MQSKMFNRVVIIVAVSLLSAHSLDLYSVLGITSEATTADIKRAYRNKARDTHPDKQRGKASPEVAATAFRAVVQAYEVLSDKNSRRNYDKSGIIPGEPGASPQRQRSSWSWGFHSDTSRTSRGQHKYLSDRVRREHIRDAQSRVIGIRSLDQLKSFIVTDGAQAQVTERYTLLSLFDSSLNGCEQLLRDEVLFPWPFAGYNYEGVQSGGMWWEEIVAVGQVDFAGGSNDLIEIATFFGVHQTLRCPTIVMIPRGISVEDIGYHFKILKEPKSAEEFMQWVWPLLKMNIFFVNKSPFPLRFYWLDGSRGKELSVVNVDETYAVNTFISHSFYARADFVDGRILTNESALLWYTARIEDDSKYIEIKSGCFDHHGDCVRWRQEGFCDRSSQTWYTRKNPSHYDFVLSNCFVSCGFGCGSNSRSKKSHFDL